LHARILLADLRESVFDKCGCIADSNVGQEVKIDRDAGELIEMINRLWTYYLLGRCYGAERNETGSNTGCDSLTGVRAGCGSSA